MIKKVLCKAIILWYPTLQDLSFFTWNFANGIVDSLLVDGEEVGGLWSYDRGGVGSDMIRKFYLCSRGDCCCSYNKTID